jgi:hypothetical protein
MSGVPLEYNLICPGHGPIATVGEENAHNRFFPKFKQAAQQNQYHE